SALPQAYLEVGYGNISVKAGKFLSPVGQESLVSPDRFFYSLDQTFGYVPATASGVLVNWDVSDKFSLFGGWIQRDQFFNNADDNAFTGGFEYQLSQKSTFGYGLVAGSDNRNDIDYFNHSLYFKHRFNNHWSYALEWALLNDQYEYSGISQNVGANVLSQSLYYQINQKWSTGFRVEWQHQYYGFGDGVDAYSLTYGVNWKPRHWILVRPEIRYDSVDGVDAFKWTKNFPPDPKSDQFAGGVSTVLKF
ncbi:MAG: porin, partial [Planctomycetaceae bacterium]|nr:porin [Planctomycetaceae bacterium]